MIKFFRRFMRQRKPAWTPPVLPEYPPHFCILKYADRASDIALVHGQYPVVMRQVADYRGTAIIGAGERQFDDAESLLSFGLRMDNIVPGALWAFRFAA